MSYQNYQTAIKLIDNNVNIITISKFPQTEEDIKKAENILSVFFPKSYRDFLKKYGTLGVMGAEIYGFKTVDYSKYVYSNIICRTLDEREINRDLGFLKTFIPIYDLGNGELFCLDTSKINVENECPLVCWSFGNIESISDEFGEDFGDFFLYEVKKGLQQLELEGKKVNW